MRHVHDNLIQPRPICVVEPLKYNSSQSENALAVFFNMNYYRAKQKGQQFLVNHAFKDLFIPFQL